MGAGFRTGWSRFLGCGRLGGHGAAPQDRAGDFQHFSAPPDPVNSA